MVSELATHFQYASGRQWPPSFSSHRQPLAPTCGQSSGRHWPPAFSSHRQPLAANRVAASGRQCPPAFSSQRQPLAATCSQSSGRKWPIVATSIWFFIGSHRQWPPAFLFSSATTCSHLQPIEWPQVAARASGRKWPPLPKSNSCPSARSLQHRVSSSSSWDQQSTSAAAHKRQLHSAVQKQSFTRSTQEQQNHFTSETSYKKHSTPRR